MLPFYNTKTLICVRNELIGRTNLINVDMLKDSTINSKYDIYKDILPSFFPTKINYFGIGNNGFKTLDDMNSLIPRKPDFRNMDLYSPIPFRCVPIDDDLDEMTQAKYRMKVMKLYNDINYWCYYLKVIEYLSTDINLVYTNLETGDEDTLIINYNNLNPIPSDIVSPDSIDSTYECNAYVDTKLIIEGNEIIEAINILYNGDLSKCNISEIGLYSGEDKVVQDSLDNEYTEAIFTQLMTHHCFTGVDLSNPSTVYEKDLRIVESTGFVL